MLLLRERLAPATTLYVGNSNVLRRDICTVSLTDGLSCNGYGELRGRV